MTAVLSIFALLCCARVVACGAHAAAAGFLIAAPGLPAHGFAAAEFARASRIVRWRLSGRLCRHAARAAASLESMRCGSTCAGWPMFAVTTPCTVCPAVLCSVCMGRRSVWCQKACVHDQVVCRASRSQTVCPCTTQPFCTDSAVGRAAGACGWRIKVVHLRCFAAVRAVVRVGVALGRA
jgi:hypothetical protein